MGQTHAKLGYPGMNREGQGYRRDRRHRKNKESSSAIWFEGSLLYFKHDGGLRVKNISTGSEILCGFKNRVHNLTSISAGILCDNVFYAAPTKRFILRVAGINNAIAKKDEDIARLSVNCDFVVGNVFKHA